MATIGVFDSGIGGLSVARAIEKALPEDAVLYVSDREHMPYGDKTSKEVFTLVVPILQQLVERGCNAIVIACNTVTTTHIEDLRKIIPVPLVGMEPMIKPAAEQTQTGVVAVCATPATLSSKRYAWLKETYTQGITVIEPDCSTWAYMIEHDQVNEAQIKQQITELCDQNADVIVLGCTHYHWIEDVIQSVAAERAVVVQPEQPVIRQLLRVLNRV
ncbi:MAG TPA: glutamate racemase [Candidatus Saccharimonadales bacterium]|nr:glutamate racemase [Candidatus Saccharimonadales bacterium]